jgi:hypothetical protein
MQLQIPSQLGPSKRFQEDTLEYQKTSTEIHHDKCSKSFILFSAIKRSVLILQNS